MERVNEPELVEVNKPTPNLLSLFKPLEIEGDNNNEYKIEIDSHKSLSRENSTSTIDNDTPSIVIHNAPSLEAYDHVWDYEPIKKFKELNKDTITFSSTYEDTINNKYDTRPSLFDLLYDDNKTSTKRSNTFLSPTAFEFEEIDRSLNIFNNMMANSNLIADDKKKKKNNKQDSKKEKKNKPDSKKNKIIKKSKEHNKFLTRLLKGNKKKEKVHSNKSTIRRRNIKREAALDKISDPKLIRRFGIFDGVIPRILVPMFSAVLLLRLGIIIGHAGLYITLVIIMGGYLLAQITTLSLSALASNGKLYGGSAYFMISRSVGPRMGGSLGFVFCVGNLFSAALNLVGFAESIYDEIQFEVDDFSLFGNKNWDSRLYATIATFFVLMHLLRGLNSVLKFQRISLMIVIGLLFLMMVGGFSGTSTNSSKGVLGAQDTLLRDNLSPKMDGKDWSFIFSLYFPSVVSIIPNISGELRNPEKVIPLGTTLALIIGTVTFVIMALLLSFCCTTDSLQNNSSILVYLSYWGHLFFFGVAWATLSSAVAAMVGGARVFRAMLKDQLFTLKWLKAESNPYDEPFRAYKLFTVFVIIPIMIGNIDAIAPFVTVVFLLTFSIVNYACFLLSYTKALSWRPHFKYYNPWVSLFGSILCFCCSFLVSLYTSFIVLGLLFFVYKYLDILDIQSNWGSAFDINKRHQAIESLIKLNRSPFNVKAFVPNILFLTGPPHSRPAAVAFSFLFNSRSALIMYGDIQVVDWNNTVDPNFAKQILKQHVRPTMNIEKPEMNIEMNIEMKEKEFSHTDSYVKEVFMDLPKLNLPKLTEETVVNQTPLHSQFTEELKHMSNRGFLHRISSNSIREGMRSLIQVGGFSHLRINTVCFGFLRKWRSLSVKEVEDYVAMIRDVFLLNVGCMIVRNIENLPQKLKVSSKLKLLARQRHKRIDIWWLDDDGGLSLLIPYLIREGEHSIFHHAHLRVISVTSNRKQIDFEQLQLARLMHRLRIKAEVVVFGDKEKDKACKLNANQVRKLHPSLRKLGLKSSLQRYYMRTAGLINEHSKDADMLFITVPVPNSKINPLEYMSYLHILSDNLPPTVLIRGNQSTVITTNL